MGIPLKEGKQDWSKSALWFLFHTQYILLSINDEPTNRSREETKRKKLPQGNLCNVCSVNGLRLASSKSSMLVIVPLLMINYILYMLYIIS